MSRELVVQLMARKKALYAEKFEIDEKLSALPPEHLWVVDQDPTEYPLDLTPEEVKVNESYLALNCDALRVQSQIHRAHFFGPRYTRSLFPTLCIACFVDHHKESLMVQVPVGNDCWDGLLQFECPECRHLLRVNPE